MSKKITLEQVYDVVSKLDIFDEARAMLAAARRHPDYDPNHKHDLKYLRSLIAELPAGPKN
jgi:hypothetical protein